MRTFLFLLTSSLIATSVIAENITVYRWTDKQNVVHFSQNQPSNIDYIELNLTKSAPATNTSALAKSKSTIQNKKVELPNQTSLCDDAKKNLETLKAFKKVQYIDSKGITKTLSADEQQQQLAIYKKQVTSYCDKK